MNKPLAQPIRFWPSVAIPIALTFAVFAVLNDLFWGFVELLQTTPSPEQLPNTLGTMIFSMMPGPILVYLGSSIVALAVLHRALGRGRLTCRDAGLSLTGWTAPKRLLALVTIGFLCYYNVTRIEMPQVTETQVTENRVAEDGTADGQEPLPSEAADVGPPPTHVAWGDYCFWFVFLLSASLTELLVFVVVGFCLSESYLQSRGFQPLLATVFAAGFASVAFGLYHYTYPEFWWSYIYYPLMLVMLVNIALFVVTRNIYLTFLLHNMFASIGFTEKQYASYPFPQGFNPAEFQNPMMLMPVIISFALPFLYLHWLEARGALAE